MRGGLCGRLPKRRGPGSPSGLLSGTRGGHFYIVTAAPFPPQCDTTVARQGPPAEAAFDAVATGKDRRLCRAARARAKVGTTLGLGI